MCQNTNLRLASYEFSFSCRRHPRIHFPSRWVTRNSPARPTVGFGHLSPVALRRLWIKHQERHRRRACCVHATMVAWNYIEAFQGIKICSEKVHFFCQKGGLWQKKCISRAHKIWIPWLGAKTVFSCKNKALSYKFIRVNYKK